MLHDTKYGRYGRRRVLEGTAGLGTVALAGCVGFGNSPGDDETDEMADEIKGWGWDVAARSLQLTAEEYEAEHDATIEIEEHGREAMKEDLQARLTSGTGAPDLAMLEMIDGPSYIDTGAIHEISDRIDPTLRPAAGEALKTKTDAISTGVDTEVSH